LTQKHFADRIALTRADTHLWSGDADRYFGNGVERQFGGWVAAAMLKAVMADAKPDHHPRALITHFLSGVTHAPISIRTKPMREGRSVSYWQAEMIQNDAVCAHAVITLGELREDAQAHTGSNMPAAVDPDAPGLMRFKPLAPFADELDARWIEGTPFANDDDAGRSLFWSRGAAGQRLDLAGLAFLADFVPPRVFYISKAFVPTSTLSMTIYFHAKLEEIEAVGEDFVLVEARGRRIEGGYWDHSASFWSPHGPLLMTTEQLAQHRG
jgi:acyl-CoA thioesterase